MCLVCCPCNALAPVCQVAKPKDWSPGQVRTRDPDQNASLKCTPTPLHNESRVSSQNNLPDETAYYLPLHIVMVLVKTAPLRNGLNWNGPKVTHNLNGPTRNDLNRNGPNHNGLTERWACPNGLTEMASILSWWWPKRPNQLVESKPKRPHWYIKNGSQKSHLYG